MWAELRGKGSAVYLFEFMIKKVTYTFLNVFLFDNKWRIKLLNVISSRITLFSFIGIRLSLSDCLTVVRKSTTDLMLHFFLFFYLPGIVSLVEQYAWGQSIVNKRYVPIPESSAFPRPTGENKKMKNSICRLDLHSNCGQMREVKSLPFLAGDLQDPDSLSLLLHSALCLGS